MDIGLVIISLLDSGDVADIDDTVDLAELLEKVLIISWEDMLLEGPLLFAFKSQLILSSVLVLAGVKEEDPMLLPILLALLPWYREQI